MRKMSGCDDGRMSRRSREAASALRASSRRMSGQCAIGSSDIRASANPSGPIAVKKSRFIPDKDQRMRKMSG